MGRGITSITDVAERQLCTGCGICAFVQPNDIQMVDDLDAGRRPLVRQVGGAEPSTVGALKFCPGVGLEAEPTPPGHRDELGHVWGPVLEVWEGYAGDAAVRFAASSGGAATALALHTIEQGDAHGVLHIRARRDQPLLNETVLSTSRSELLEATGSRYAPASPCDRLDLVEAAPGRSVFIGKPCDVAAVAKLRRERPVLDDKLALTVAIFCAGTPTLRGTHQMLARMGIDDPAQVVGLRYRGNGWPGVVEARVRTEREVVTRELSYEDAWGGVLQRHRQWRCYVCPDHTGEFADISVGDPWYRPLVSGEHGQSLIIVRSERGRQALAEAVASGAIVAQRVSTDLLPASQPNLLKVRGAVWGRVVVSRLFGVPAPRFKGMPMFGTWLRKLAWREKLRSTVGSVRRIRRRGLRRRHPVRPYHRDDPHHVRADAPDPSRH
jgi:coenzyme F420 hydrogenase subunit beta